MEKKTGPVGSLLGFLLLAPLFLAALPAASAASADEANTGANTGSSTGDLGQQDVDCRFKSTATETKSDEGQGPIRSEDNGDGSDQSTSAK